jgi:hypothetical protein
MKNTAVFVLFVAVWYRAVITTDAYTNSHYLKAKLKNLGGSSDDNNHGGGSTVARGLCNNIRNCKTEKQQKANR